MAATAVSKPTAHGSKEEPKDVRKVHFAYEGDKIILPEDMDLDEAIVALQRQSKEENVTVTISESVDASPLDGAYALLSVLKERYGWTNLVPTPGFFGDTPPRMIGVQVGPDEWVQVPWGNMQVPKIEGVITTSVGEKRGIPHFVISGKVKRKHERLLAALAKEVREFVRTRSIYRGKAIRMNYRDSDDEQITDVINLTPEFLKLDGAGTSDPIFSKEIEDAVKLNILNPLRYSTVCKQNGISLKRGIILGGPYGTGKTLTAFQTAREAVKNGWTFVYLQDVRDLDKAIAFAKLYQPCVLFAEDLDKATSGERDPEMDRMLNTIDGIESKGDQQLMMVLTTNRLESIHRSFLRPGRIDSIINVQPPDNEACVRILRKYVFEGNCTLVGTQEQLEAAIQPLVGANAAFFRNVVDQAKLAAVPHQKEGEARIEINHEDLAAAALALETHAKIINPDHGIKSLEQMVETGENPLLEGLGRVIDYAADRLKNPPKAVARAILKEVRKGH